MGPTILPLLANFYPRPPHGERLSNPKHSLQLLENFYPRPPHGERRVYYLTLEETDTISIHAPRMGSDVCLPRLYTLQIIFLSTPPAWGATRGCNREYRRVQFLSTPPAWGATRAGIHRRQSKRISIHAPRMGSDIHNLPLSRGTKISIHAPRMGSDVGCSVVVAI